MDCGLRGLRPLQWENHQDKIAFEGLPKVSAEGLRNTQQLH